MARPPQVGLASRHAKHCHSRGRACVWGGNEQKRTPALLQPRRTAPRRRPPTRPPAREAPSASSASGGPASPSQPSALRQKKATSLAARRSMARPRPRRHAAPRCPPPSSNAVTTRRLRTAPPRGPMGPRHPRLRPRAVALGQWGCLAAPTVGGRRLALGPLARWRARQGRGVTSRAALGGRRPPRARGPLPALREPRAWVRRSPAAPPHPRGPLAGVRRTGRSSGCGSPARLGRSRFTTLGECQSPCGTGQGAGASRGIWVPATPSGSFVRPGVLLCILSWLHTASPFLPCLDG